MNVASIISIANQFSRYPAGRYLDDGPFTGEAFRQQFLVPALEQGVHTIIKLDGVRGYGSSFLEEAFGGLVRLGFTSEKIHEIFEFEAEDKSLVDEIEEYIADAELQK